jgi:hypothetical protein
MYLDSHVSKKQRKRKGRTMKMLENKRKLRSETKKNFKN